MTEIGGKLMEVGRREINPSPVYYFAVQEPMQAKVMYNPDITQPPVMKRERWAMHSKPISEDDFAVFLLDGIE